MARRKPGDDYHIEYYDGDWTLEKGDSGAIAYFSTKGEAKKALAKVLQNLEDEDTEYDRRDDDDEEAEDELLVGSLKPIRKRTKPLLDQGGVEAELRNLHKEIRDLCIVNAHQKEDYLHAQDEIKKLKGTIHTIQAISDKRLKDLEHLRKLLGIADKAIATLEAKCSTDHVLAVRKLPPLELKRGYKGG